MKYDIERAAVTLSVKELCTLAYLEGDLDLRPGRGYRPSFERAALGAEIHRKLQAEAGALYRAEVSLVNTTLYESIAFEVSGRADGIICADGTVTVDEIKTVSAKAFDLPPLVTHDAQLKCYGYFVARERELEAIDLRLTYYCTADGRIRYHTQTYTAEELAAYYRWLLSRILYRAQILVEHETVLRPSARAAHFPYRSVREGQDIMIREVYRDIRASKRLFVEAPTGTGKTLSALYPAVRALGEGYCDKIFYLTAKAATRREAFRAAAQLFSAGTQLRTVILTAREQICVNEAARADEAGVSHHCNPVDCPRAKGFFDRLGAALCEALSTLHGFSRTSVLEIAERHHLCPYEFQLALSEFCDTVICDYNYAFDPMVYLRRYFEPDAVAQNRYVFLVDEAHNLADRATAMYSAHLTARDVSALWQMLPEGDALFATLEKLSVPMQGFCRLCESDTVYDEDGVPHGFYINRAPMEDFCRAVSEVRTALDARLRTECGEVLEKAIYRLAVTLKHFEVVSEHYDDHFLTFIEREGDSCSLRLICLDPSRILNTCFSRAQASVLFSATLTPSDYFADILGGGKGAVRISVPSPFRAEQFALVAVANLSTRYEDRAKSHARIASLLAATASGKPGNYIAYFPSYAYMEAVLEKFKKKYPKVSAVVQTRGMRADQREEFLSAFRDDGKLRVGFCVLGGSFSEGIDLPGGQLIGSIIVGTGLPGLSSERNILRDYYETTRERGYDYAYTYPGMNRVLQAAGRVIRRTEDRGVIVLIDDRYAEPRYTQLFPDHWSHLQYAENSMELAEIVRDFWKLTKNDG